MDLEVTVNIIKTKTVRRGRLVYIWMMGYRCQEGDWLKANTEETSEA